ncbi:MAG TPA: 3-deoxy-7-phosphoheptulonate synthase [Chthonomonadales bacterium]|nr:3-deoxy-7-phosphoheptulonate synthase [Chthonomonadales bacterium]
MIVVMAAHATEEQIRIVEQRITEWGYRSHPIYGQERTVIGAVGVPEADKLGYMEQLESLDYVERVIPILRPYKFVAREYRLATTTIDVRGVTIGGPSVVVMAGPCTVEDYEQTLETARAVKDAGARILRGGAFKPCTSPYSFQGLGLEGLRILKAVSQETGLPVITEVMDPRMVDVVCEYADILQIGTRNMQNYDLLREVGRSSTPVLLKRGMWAKIDEWLNAAEYVVLGGNPEVMLCERGIRTFETHTRNTLDLSAVPAVKQISHLPVIVDPSQGTGKWSLVEPMAKAAIACGADGLLVEVHRHPDKAIKDGAQSLTHGNFAGMIAQTRAIAAAVGREL